MKFFHKTKFVIVLLVVCSTIGMSGYAFDMHSYYFADVPTDHQYANDINLAYEMGIIRGDGSGQFAPDQYLTARQMCLMFGRAFTNVSSLNDREYIQLGYQFGWVDGMNIGIAVGVNQVTFYKTLCIAANIVPYKKLTSIYDTAPSSPIMMATENVHGFFDALQETGFPIGRFERWNPISRGEAVHVIMMVLNGNYDAPDRDVLDQYHITIDTGANPINALWTMMKLPQCVLHSFDEKNWTLEINSPRLEAWNAENGRNAVGVTLYAQKTIIVKDEHSLLHEFGHFVWKHLRKADRQAVSLLYQRESNRLSELLGEYSTTNPGEYFAEIFDFWMTNHSYQHRMDELRSFAPKTYLFFEELEDHEWRYSSKS